FGNQRRDAQPFWNALADFAQRVARAVAVGDDALQDRLRHRPDVDLRIELAPEPFDVEQGLLKQDQLWLQRQLELARGAEEFRDHFRQRDFRQRPREIRLAYGADRGFQLVHA